MRRRLDHRVRTKFRDIPGYDGLAHRVTPFGAWLDRPYVQVPYHKYEHIMHDTVGFPACDANPCHNLKIQAIGKINPLSVISWVDPDGSWSESYGLEKGIMPPAMSSVVDYISIPGLSYWIDNFSALSEHHFKTAVEMDDSLLNFLIELIELCEGNIEKLKKVADVVEKAIELFRITYKKTGDYWLSWNFAIKPTISDVKNILLSLVHAMKRLDWLKKRNHLDTKIKYRQGPRTFESSFSIPEEALIKPILDQTKAYPGNPTVVTLPVPSDWQLTLECSVTSEVALASQGWVRFDIPDEFLDGPEGIGIVWSALQGLYNPLKVVWEAVPFSWLIDWFVDMRTRLQLEAADFSPLKDAKIISTCWSLRSQHKIEMVWRVQANGSVYYVDCGMLVASLYNRQPDLPIAAGSPFVVPIEWYNLSILLGLIQQKHRRH